jgi:ABC-2 type transport system permease protein
VARLLVQLKLRLLRNALLSSTAAKASFVTSTIFAALIAAGTFTSLSLLRGNSASVDVTAVVFTLFAFGWLIGPIFAFGLDGTLDPATLALYPLRTRPLAAGLLTASAAGAWPVANVLGLLGTTVGLASGALGVLTAVIAVLLQVAFCIALARFVTTTMAALLRSRRGKDLAAFLVIPLFALYELFTQVLPKAVADGKITASSFGGVDTWLRWLPPGLAAHAIQDASHGRPGIALLRLAVLAAIAVVLGWLWIRSLDRALVTTDMSTQSSRVRRAGLFSGAPGLPLGRHGVRGVLAARFLVYQRREPGYIVWWSMIAVIMAVVSIKAVIGPNTRPGLLLASAVAGAGFVGFGYGNSVGSTGPAFVFEALALTGRRQLRAYFSGQDIALAVIGIPLLAAVSFGLAGAAGHPGYGFLGTALDLAGLGAALALSNVFSVLLPYPMEQRAGNPMRQAAQGHGSQVLLAMLGSLGGVGVAVTPLLVAIALTSTDRAAIRMPVLVSCAAVYGLALAWAGVRIAARAAEERLPELCQIAMRSKP